MAETTRETNPANPGDAAGAEWLLTAGSGAFAMGTALGANTRRYHGWLVAATQPPVGRVVALHSIAERLEFDGGHADLSTFRFEPALDWHPEGWRSLAALCVRTPSDAAWRYDIGAMRVTRSVRLHRSPGAVTIRYAFERAPAGARMWLRPLTPLRDMHALAHEPLDAPVIHRVEANAVRIERDGVGLHMESTTAGWSSEPQWWRRFAYEEDRARGQEWIEDVWSAGTFFVELERDATIEIHARLDPMPALTPRTGDDASRARWPAFGPSSPQRDRLRDASSQFVVTGRGDAGGHSIIAGYPWFTDWGRDTMISLPGLLLTPGRFDAALAVLKTYARHLRRGLLPNAFDDHGAGANYHTADASLWFVHAVRAYVDAGGALDASLIDACRDVIAGYRDGTDYGIGLDPDDDLIRVGDGGASLTWMDAQRGGVRFTPREGKPVEINALWYNALCSLAEMAGNDPSASRWREMAQRTAQSIRTRFWWTARQCLVDVLPTPEDDTAPALRPNQILAVSLPHSPLTDTQQRGVVHAVRTHLLTPYGLRTLESSHPRYIGRYEGNLMQRDAAYHNGTVWPWLIGPYCDAVLRVQRSRRTALDEVRAVIAPLLGELDRGCMHHVAEVYDGDPPHRPSGCTAQAWSIAELQRIVTIVDRASPREEGRTTGFASS